MIERTLPEREINVKSGMSDGGRASRSPPPRGKLGESELSRTTTRYTGASAAARAPFHYKVSESAFDSDNPDMFTSGDETAEINVLQAKLDLAKAEAEKRSAATISAKAG